MGGGQVGTAWAPPTCRDMLILSSLISISISYLGDGDCGGGGGGGDGTPPGMVL